MIELGKSVKKKSKVSVGSVGATAITPKISNTASAAITTITPTAITTPIQTAAAKKDDTDLVAKINNIVVASSALPHGTNCSI